MAARIRLEPLSGDEGSVEVVVERVMSTYAPLKWAKHDEPARGTQSLHPDAP